MERRIILIGGAPTSGKSTVAKALSARLGLPWISTDQLRSVMRAMTTTELIPALFNVTDDPVEFLTRYSAEEIARMEWAQGEAAWPGIRAFVRSSYDWESGFIVEWVNVIPSLVARDFGRDNRVRPVFLLDEDEDRIRRAVYTRGLWDDASRYPDHVKEKEVEWVQAYNRLLVADAERSGLPVVRVDKTDGIMDPVLSALGLG